MYYTILESLKRFHKEMLLAIILDLMREGKITLADIAMAHTQHLEELRKGQSAEMQKLGCKVIHLHCDFKKNRDKNIGEIMHYLLDEGRVNTTHEKIDKKYGKE